MKNFQPIAFISPTNAVSAANYFRPVKANFDALVSTTASSGSELVGESHTAVAYSQTGNSVHDHIAGIDTAIGGKEPTLGASTYDKYYRGDKTFQILNATVVPASATATTYTPITPSVEGHLMGINTALGLKAPLLSPTFTGTTTASALSVTTQAYFGSEIANGNSGTSKTINWTLGNKQSITLTGACTATFTAPTGPTNLILRCIGDGTVRTITWPTTVKWAGNVTPTMTGTLNKWDIIGIYFDGTNYSAAISQLFG